VAYFATVFQTCFGRSRESRTTPCRRTPERPRSVNPSRGRDTRRKTPRCTEVILSISAAQDRPNRSPSPCRKEFPVGRHRASSVASMAARSRDVGRIQRRVGLCSRKGSMTVHRRDLGSGLNSVAGFVSLGRVGPIELLRLKALVRVGISGDFHQFAHSTPAATISFAIKNEIDGFRRLRTNECMVQI
jgi:hypothetical protein